MLLAGDIGGTKTVLAVYTPEQGPHDPLVEKRFPSDDYDSLETIVVEFLQEVDYPLTHAAFGVAGPVVSGRAEITNLPWVIDEKHLAERCRLEHVHLLNDLQAIANAVPVLQDDNVADLKPGRATAEGAIAVVAPGTGLGEAFLVWDGSRYRAYPTEGGHADFGPADELQLALLNYLQPRLGHVSYERVCSGIGIPNLYAFMRDIGRYPEPEWLRDALDDAEDATPIIVETAQAGEAAICVATLDLFIDILAREAGNAALKFMATGGVYLGGGIPPRILPQLQASDFAEIFTDKGRFSDLLADVPVRVILNPKVALVGAAQFGLTMMNGNPIT